MTRPIQFLFGPEFLWALLYVLVLLAIRVTGSPSRTMDATWVATAWAVPLVAVPLGFALYYVPDTAKNYLLLRQWIAGLFGAHYVLSKSLGAHSEQGPGVGTAYLMGIILVFVLLVAGSIFVKIRF